MKLLELIKAGFNAHDSYGDLPELLKDLEDGVYWIDEKGFPIGSTSEFDVSRCFSEYGFKGLIVIPKKEKQIAEPSGSKYIQKGMLIKEGDKIMTLPVGVRIQKTISKIQPDALELLWQMRSDQELANSNR